MKWLRWPALMLCLVVVLVAALYLRPDADLDAAIAEFKAPNSRFVSIANNTVLHIRVSGPDTGVPLVLLHGFGSSSWAWDGWVSRLPTSVRTIAVDLPCHGLTRTGDGPEANPSSPIFLTEMLDALRIQRAVIVGNSLGGATAARFAAQYPDRVAAGILVDAPRGAPPSRVKVLTSRWYSPLARLALRWSKGPEGHRDDIFWRLHRADLVRVSGDEMHTPSAAPSSIMAPTLVMQGGADPLVSRSDAEAWAHGIRRARLVIFPGLGHTPHQSDPAVTSKSALDFLIQIGLEPRS
ncbi:MAG TPA: alpha/beta hydrolase [Caulobacterales bacterium]|nr:alpha/beta hydrolase [Caulobacterales bacterium]